MYAVVTSDATGVLAIVAIVLMVVCTLVAVVGTRIVRSKQRQKVRHDRHLQQARSWRPSRRPEPPKGND